MLFRLFVILTKWKGCNIIDAVISHLYGLIMCPGSLLFDYKIDHR